MDSFHKDFLLRPALHVAELKVLTLFLCVSEPSFLTCEEGKMIHLMPFSTE